MASENRPDFAFCGLDRPAVPGFRATVLLGTAGAGILAFAGLFAYVPGLRELTGIPPDYIFMAPSTAGCFLMLSMALFRHARKPWEGPGMMVMATLILFAVTLSLVEVANIFAWRSLTFEDIPFPAADRPGGTSLAQMSPATGAAFALAGFGVFLLLLRPRSARLRRRLGDCVSSLGALTLLAGTTVLLSHVHGTPLLYGGTAVPMTVASSITFLFLGIAMLAAAGQDSFPVCKLIGDSTSARLARAILSMIVVLVLVQSALPRFVPALYMINDALLWAVLDVTVAAGTAIVAGRVAHAIGRNLDEANETLSRTFGSLRESEERLRMAAEAGNVGLWDWDLSTNRVHYSAVWKRQIGFGDHEISDDYGEWQSRVHPEDLDGAVARVQAFLNAPYPNYENEFRFRHKDGSYRTILARASVLYGEDGRPSHMLGAHLDITERKQAEKALLASEERFRLAAKCSSDYIYERDMQTGQAQFFGDIDAHLGYPPGGFPRTLDGWMEHIHPEDLSRVMEAIQGSVQHDMPYEVEYRVRKGDGTHADWSDHGLILWDAAGNPAKNIGASTDISERRRAEALLSARLRLMKTAESCSLTELLRATIDEAEAITGSQAGFFHFVEPDQVTLSLQAWSTNTLQNMCTTAGEGRHYPASEAGVWADCLRERRPLIHNDYPSLPHRKGLPEGHVPIIRELVVPVQRGGSIVALLGVGNNPVNYTDWNLETVAALADFAWDSIAHKRAEEALVSSRTLLQSMADNSASLIYALDLEGRYLLFNRGLESLFGVSREAMIGKTREGVMTSEIAAAHRANDLRVIQERSPIAFEEKNEEPDGTHTYLSVKFPLLNPSGGIYGIGGISSDITGHIRAEEERAALEAKLQQAQKMESVGRLAGGVAHDFNNMLAVILGHMELALDKVNPDEPLHADLEEVRKAATHSADLTRQLLAFARRQTIMPRVLDLNETLAGMLKMLQRLIGENVSLNWHPAANLWPVKVDPSQIDQILANLCVNARDAITNVGRLTIETANCDVDRECCAHNADAVPGDYVQLSVSDNGCGMDEEMLARVFDPFFTTKGVGEGTGLGLATVYGAVRQNGGFINVWSEPGQGTKFTLYLPRHAGETGQTPTAGLPPPALRGHETILLVEDEPTVLKMTARLLHELGYTVMAAGSAEKAGRLAQEHAGEIHLLVTDVIMPETNGRDLASSLLSLRPNLKCLFMSGYTADVIAHHGMLDKGMHFIQKPFSTQNLAAKVREVLHGG